MVQLVGSGRFSSVEPVFPGMLAVFSMLPAVEYFSIGRKFLFLNGYLLLREIIIRNIARRLLKRG